MVAMKEKRFLERYNTMNIANLHKLIERYEENFDFINNSSNNEAFKWRAVKQFRDVWFSEEAKSMRFSDMFTLAKKESSVMIDNSRVSPTNGIVKVAEQEQDAMEYLFRNVLLAKDNGDLIVRQNNMDIFLAEFEKLRMKYFPQCWKYKQDRHAVMCYLVFLNPEDNYIYRYSDVETFAQYIEFGMDIGSGDAFRLDVYYQMCDQIVLALREHTALIDRHLTFLNEEHYRDESLHLLAFDIMYCARTYNLYEGLSHAPKKLSTKAYTEAQRREKERQEYQKKVDALMAEITELENRAAVIEEISLLNVQVYQPANGTGLVIAQTGNMITVRFSQADKNYIISRKYPIRPTFEDDQEILDAYTEYENICKKLKLLKSDLKRLQC